MSSLGAVFSILAKPRSLLASSRRCLPRMPTPAIKYSRPEPVRRLDPLEKCDDDKPTSAVANPFIFERTRCVACKYNLKFDYKNVRLLSQFVSSFSGRLYEKHQTGLCTHQHKKLRTAIIIARKSALMPVLAKEPRFLRDPKLFDPMHPMRPNPH